MKKCWDLLTDVTELDGDFLELVKVVTWRVESFFGLQLQLQAGRILKESRSRVKRGTV